MQECFSWPQKKTLTSFYFQLLPCVSRSWWPRPQKHFMENRNFAQGYLVYHLSYSKFRYRNPQWWQSQILQPGSLIRSANSKLHLLFNLFFFFYWRITALQNFVVFCQTSNESAMLLLSRFSHVWLCATPQTAAHQAPPSLGFSRQEHWSGSPFPSPMQESEKWKWSCSVMSDS